MRETTVAASLVIDLVAHLARRGLARDEVCRAAGIEPTVLEAPDERLPGSAMERLWRAGESLAGDADLGLHAAESYNPGALSILGYVVLNCRTSGEALEKLGRYAALLHDGLRVQITHEAGDTVLGFDAVAATDNYLARTPRHAMETLAAGVVCTLSALTGAALVPREVAFRHPAPPATAEHERIFGVRPRFGRPVDRMVLRSIDLERPVRSANAALLSVFARHADEMLEQVAQHGPVSRRLLQVLAKRLQGGSPPLGDVASAMAMSARNLQRTLREEGTSFQDLLDHARRELALRHLAAPEGSAAEVAFLLGFADASAFTRAFRRWTGSTPGAWRARERASEAARIAP